MRLIDAEKLHLKLLYIDFPLFDQDVILDAMDDCSLPFNNTNADYIRNMTDEELATFICSIGWQSHERKECLEWLKSEKGEW